MLLRLLLALTAFIVVPQAPAAVSVEGRVTGGDGQPVVGAVVAIVPSLDTTAATQVRTAADGRFRLTAGAGTVGLTVTAPGQLPHFRSLEVKAGIEVPSLGIQLRPGGHRVEGRVIPAPGKTLDGVRLGFAKYSADEGDVFFADVTADGRFAVSLAPGEYFVVARADRQNGPDKRMSITGDMTLVRIVLESEPAAASPEVRAWIGKNAISLKTVEAEHGLEDLAPLTAVVGTARVVALGEATHGTREFFQLKHRMLEFLAEKMGFTVFAIEANLPEAFAVNEYVLTGKGDPAQALAGLYFWTWNTEEVLDMIRWMRRYNEAPAHTRKLKFYGFDMQTPTVAYAQAKASLAKTDPEGAAMLQRTLQGITSTASTTSLDRAAAKGWKEAADALGARMESRRAALVKAAGAREYERQRQNLRILAQCAEMNADAQGPSRVRDEAMAANVRWILEQEKGAKMVLWAHNGHVSFQAGSMGTANPMGWHLRQALGRDYLVFGFAFAEGSFQAIDYGPDKKGLINFEVKSLPALTLSNALASAGMPSLALDLRSLPASGPAREWFDAPQGTWSIGAAFSMAGQAGYIQRTAPTVEYDALLFVNRTTAARANPSGRRPAAPLSLPGAPANLGFENGEAGKPALSWSVPPGADYVAQVSVEQPKEGARCLRVQFQGTPKGGAWTSVMQAIDATSYRGKKIRVTGWVRTDGRNDVKAGLWVRVDRPAGMGFFDNMMNRAIGATEWTEAVIEGTVDGDARVLNFGCLVNGSGTAWFDGIRIEVVGSSPTPSG